MTGQRSATGDRPSSASGAARLLQAEHMPSIACKSRLELGRVQDVQASFGRDRGWLTAVCSVDEGAFVLWEQSWVSLDPSMRT